MKKLGVLVILFSLAGCGGSSNLTNVSLTKVFPDRAGIITGSYANGSKVAAVWPDAAATVVESNKNTSSNMQASSFPIVGSYSTGKVRSGAITDGRFSANITVYEDSSGDAVLFYADEPGSYNGVMGIVAPYTAPTGTFSYSGLFAAADRTYSSSLETGSFTMSANFSAKTVVFNGQTTSYLLTGNATLDSDTGTFNSNTFRFEDANYYYEASIYGLMGGNGATATSGVFHTNDYSVDYAGAFVGQR
jgi:hypothetical protein